MATSPTKRSLAECQKRGWNAQVVERRIPYSHITVDLFGCIDIVCITENTIVGIQCTSASNHAARVEKCRAEPRIALWMKAGASMLVWSWGKKGARGKRKTWQLREEAL